MAVFFFTPVFAQDSEIDSETPYMTYTEYFKDEDLIVAFVLAAVTITGLFLFLFRESIFSKKKQNRYVSDADRDYEKYHSKWGGESEYLGDRKITEDEEEYREASRDSKLPNYYKILGVNRDATADEIKDRFRKLAKEWHPDKTSDQTNEMMSEINKAYEVLSDADKRGIYDKYLK